MIILISPAKTLNSNVKHLANSTEPEFKKEINELVGIMKRKSKSSIQKLMGISDDDARECPWLR